MATAPLLRRQLQAVLDRGAVRVAVDVSRVGFIDAAGIGVLVSATRRAAAQGGMLRLRRVNAPAGRVLGLVGLEWMVDDGPAPGHQRPRCVRRQPSVEDEVLARRLLR